MIYGIIGAMNSEIALLTAQMQNTATTVRAGLTFYQGTIGGSAAVIVKCGIGKVNAALCTQALIDAFDVDAVINVGIAGGVSPALKVLDTVVGAQLIQHDFDLSPFGYVKAYLGADMGGDGTQPTVFAADVNLVRRAKAAAEELCGDEHTAYTGTIVSGDAFIAAAEKKAELFEVYHAMAAEMEGASIAQVATLNGIPFVVLRTISDLADGGAPVSYETVEQYAADLSAAIVVKLLEESA